jgi:hypothetical protein
MSRGQIEFANVLCHFGKDKVLLDYLEEIVLPAFTDDTLVRQRGRETPTSYHFYDVVVEVLDKTVTPPLIGVSGQFVKDVHLTRTQIYDDSRGLVEDHRSMASSPSSYFLFMFNNHQLIYLPKTPHAPTIGEFSATIGSFIKRKHVDYINKLHKDAKSSASRVTKRSLWESHPGPAIDIVPLATTESVASFINRFSLLKVIQFKLLKPSPAVVASDVFVGMQGILAELHAKSGQVVTKSDSGLDKPAATRVVGAAAAAGTNEIRLQGDAPDGSTLSGSNDDFKIRVPLETIPPTRKGVVDRMVEAFTSTVSHLVPRETTKNSSRERKLDDLANKL